MGLTESFFAAAIVAPIVTEVVRRSMDWAADNVFSDTRQPALVPTRK